MNEATLLSSVVKMNNSVLLQLLYVQYFYLAEEIEYMMLVGQWQTTLILSIPRHTLHYCHNIRIFLICFLALALLLNKNMILHAQKHFKIFIVTVYDHTKEIVND